MTYDPEANSQRSYHLAMTELRRAYEASHLPGETAAQWMARTRPHSSLRALVEFASS